MRTLARCRRCLVWVSLDPGFVSCGYLCGESHGRPLDCVKVCMYISRVYLWRVVGIVCD